MLGQLTQITQRYHTPYNVTLSNKNHRKNLKRKTKAVRYSTHTHQEQTGVHLEICNAVQLTLELL